MYLPVGSTSVNPDENDGLIDGLQKESLF